MNVLIYLVPLALFLGLLGLVGFMWALSRGQFEDLEGAGWRAISDDDLRDEASLNTRPAHVLAARPYARASDREELRP
jgi:cbb3-type cytochrome oxidase maturation protein